MGVWENNPDGGFPFRLKRVERIVDNFQDWKGDTDKILAQRGEQFKNMDEKVDGLVRAVDSLRKVILGFALSVAGSAVVFALSILIATGKIGG